tara:strand:- start:1544 stop:1711 length:168 start_codon:yes stop_codon:yes gene_type:complete
LIHLVRILNLRTANEKTKGVLSLLALMAACKEKKEEVSEKEVEKVAPLKVTIGFL